MKVENGNALRGPLDFNVIRKILSCVTSVQIPACGINSIDTLKISDNAALVNDIRVLRLYLLNDYVQYVSQEWDTFLGYVESLLQRELKSAKSENVPKGSAESCKLDVIGTSLEKTTGHIGCIINVISRIRERMMDAATVNDPGCESYCPSIIVPGNNHVKICGHKNIFFSRSLAKPAVDRFYKATLDTDFHVTVQHLPCPETYAYPRNSITSSLSLNKIHKNAKVARNRRLNDSPASDYRGVVAAKGFIAGKIIFYEAPLIFSPSYGAHPSANQLCDGCGKRLCSESGGRDRMASSQKNVTKVQTEQTRNSSIFGDERNTISDLLNSSDDESFENELSESTSISKPHVCTKANTSGCMQKWCSENCRKTSCNLYHRSHCSAEYNLRYLFGPLGAYQVNAKSRDTIRILAPLLHRLYAQLQCGKCRKSFAGNLGQSARNRKTKSSLKSFYEKYMRSLASDYVLSSEEFPLSDLAYLYEIGLHYGFSAQHLDASILLQICRVLLTNFFQLGNGKGCGFFPRIASFINHNCNPNACYSWENLPQNPRIVKKGIQQMGSRVLCFRALRNIQAGEEVTISYLPMSIGNQERVPEGVLRRPFLERYNIVCNCGLCVV